MENTLTGEKSQKNLPISNNFGPKPNFFKFLLYTLGRVEWSKKLSRATVPLNVGGGEVCYLCVERSTVSEKAEKKTNN